jgi:hypothetical protein
LSIRRRRGRPPRRPTWKIGDRAKCKHHGNRNYGRVGTVVEFDHRPQGTRSKTYLCILEFDDGVREAYHPLNLERAYRQGSEASEGRN